MVRNRLWQNVDLLKIAEGRFSAVVEPSLETGRSLGCSTLENDGRVSCGCL